MASQKRSPSFGGDCARPANWLWLDQVSREWEAPFKEFCPLSVFFPGVCKHKSAQRVSFNSGDQEIQVSCRSCVMMWRNDFVFVVIRYVMLLVSFMTI